MTPFELQFPDGSAGMPIERAHFLHAVHAERMRQSLKWGDASQDGFDRKFAAILGEEYGEVCRALLEDDVENLREEIVQVAAVCARAWERLESVRGGSR